MFKKQPKNGRMGLNRHDSKPERKTRKTFNEGEMKRKVKAVPNISRVLKFVKRITPTPLSSSDVDGRTVRGGVIIGERSVVYADFEQCLCI